MTKCSKNLTDSKSRVVCSANLTKHLKLLKTERNRLLTLHDNGCKVTPEDFANYIQHKNYVTTLLHTEKMKAFDKMLLKAQKSS